MKELFRRNLSLLAILLAIVLSTTAILSFGVGRGTSSSTGGGAGEDTIGTTLKIGLPRIASGPDANFGAQGDMGAELAVKEINDSGYLGNVKVELVKADTEGDTAKAKTAIQKLVQQDKVAIIVGPQSSSEMIAGGDVVQQAGLAMVSPTATNPKATSAGNSLFSVAYTDKYQSQVLAQFIKEQGKKKVAILFNNANDYSKGIKEDTEAKLKELGVEVVAVESYNKGDSDFNAQIQRVKSSGADAFVIPDNYGTVLQIGNTARPILGKDVTFYGVDAWGGITDKTTDDSFENSYFVNSFAPDAKTEAIQNFYKKFKETYEKEPTFVAANTYDAIYVAADAYKNATSKTPEAMRDAVEKTSKEYVAGKIEFTPDRFALKPAMIIQIVKGENGKMKEQYKETISLD